MLLEKMKGGLLGLAVGDALGVPVASQPRSERLKDPVTQMRGWGTHHQPPGTWSDATGISLAALESPANGFDPEDMMEHFSRWMDGEYRPYGEVFGAENSTVRAVERYRRGVPAEECGGTEATDYDKGSLMRMLPMAYALYPKYGANVCRNAEARGQIGRYSALTHAHPRVKIACQMYVGTACALLSGQSVRAATQEGVLETARAYLGTREEQELDAWMRLADLDALCRLPTPLIRSSSYVVHTLEAALYCLNTTKSCAECVLKVVNLGDDTDAVGAVTGALAGIYYGEKGIPAAWRMQIPCRGRMEELLKILYHRLLNVK